MSSEVLHSTREFEKNTLSRDRYWIGGSFLLSIVLTLPVFSAVQYFYEDSYIYLSLAKSLQHGTYRFYGLPNMKYVPGYPIAVFLMHQLTGGLISWITAGKLVSLFSRMALIIPLYLVSVQLFNRRAARITIMIWAMQTYSILYGVLIYREPLAALGTMTTLCLLLKRKALSSGIWAGCTALVRPEGNFLFFSAMMSLSPKSLFRFIVGCGAVQLPWFIRNMWLSGRFFGSSGYMEEIVAHRHAGWRYLLHYLHVLGPVVFLACVLGIGVAVKKRNTWPLLGFLATHTALHMWWWWNDERFIVQVLPICVVFAGMGVSYFISQLSSDGVRRIVLSFGIIFLFIHIIEVGKPLLEVEVKRSLNYLEGVRRLDEIGDPGAVISADPAFIEHNSHRKAIGSWQDNHLDPREFLFKACKTMNVTFLITSNRYASDIRYRQILENHESPLIIHLAVRCPDGVELWRLTITRLDTIQGPSPVFNTDYAHPFRPRRLVELWERVELFQLHLERPEILGPGGIEAFVLDNPHYCDTAKQ